MAIHPPSDLILDVAKAADPAKAQAAADRLRALSAQRTSPAGDAPVFSAAPAEPAASSLSALETSSLHIRQQTDPYTKFESFVLQTFVQSMFTGNDEGVFGKGTAGQYWKSMLSGAIADSMAESGGVGIAKMLRTEAARKQASAETNGPGAAHGQTAPASQDDASAASSPPRGLSRPMVPVTSGPLNLMPIPQPLSKQRTPYG